MNADEVRVGIVGSLNRGLQILDMFGPSRTKVGIGEMAAELGVHKSSASRLAATLAAAGYLRTTGAPGTYSLGSRLAVLGPLAAAEVDLRNLVFPYLKALADYTGETGHLGVLENGMARTVAVADGWHTVRMHSWVGKQSPAYRSSIGKVLLAGRDDDFARALFAQAEVDQRGTEKTVASETALIAQLGEIRAEGFAIDNEELEKGLRCVGAPIYSADGRIEASISVSGPTQRLTIERMPLLAEHVRWAAWKASEALGAKTPPIGWPPPPTAEPEPLDWLER